MGHRRRITPRLLIADHPNARRGSPPPVPPAPKAPGNQTRGFPLSDQPYDPLRVIARYPSSSSCSWPRTVRSPTARNMPASQSSSTWATRRIFRRSCRSAGRQQLRSWLGSLDRTPVIDMRCRFRVPSWASRALGEMLSRHWPGQTGEYRLDFLEWLLTPISSALCSRLYPPGRVPTDRGDVRWRRASG